MTFEPFAIGHSVLHRLDPRCRLVTAAIFSAIVAVLDHFQALILALVVALALVAAARLPWRPLIVRLGRAGAFVLMLWIVLPLTQNGTELFRIGPLAIQDAGVALAGAISLKTGAILLAFIALVATMPVATLGHTLDRLGMTPKLTFLLLMCYRYLFVLEQEYLRLVRAARIRGFRAGTNRHTYRTYAYLVGMLFVRAADRAERVHQAMRCRGFNGRFHSIQTFAVPGRREAAFIVLMGLAVCAVVFFEVQPPA